jgi:general secretion pathway protein D
LDSIDEGPFLTSQGGATFFIPGVIDNSAGSATFNANTIISNDPGVDGSGVLAIFHFTALAAGTSPVSIFNELLLDSNVAGIPDTVLGGSVQVNNMPAAVPEPSTFALFGVVGVFICAGMRRRSRLARPV